MMSYNKTTKQIILCSLVANDIYAAQEINLLIGFSWVIGLLADTKFSNFPKRVI